MSTRMSVLQALRGAGSAPMSGESLARELGLSRVAVAKHIAALRADGYVIEARAGEGYRLTSAPDLPLPDEVAPLLKDPLWIRVEGGEETTSTNDDARRLAEKGAVEGTVVVAAKQTAGRGRFGRQWVSPAGGAYISVVLRPPVGTTELASLPLAVAVGVARGLGAVGAKPSLKWPNDVLLGGAKVAGILLEMSGQADCVDWVVVGVGVNVRAVDEEMGRLVGAVAEHAPEVRTAQVAAAALDGIAGAYRDWLESGFESLREEFADFDSLRGAEVTARDLGGRVIASGVASAIDELGRLVIETGSGTRHIASGDVTLRDS